MLHQKRQTYTEAQSDWGRIQIITSVQNYYVTKYTKEKVRFEDLVKENLLLMNVLWERPSDN